MPEKKTEAAFIEPMLLLRTERLPQGPGWLVELKFDGYRALAITDGGKVAVRTDVYRRFRGLEIPECPFVNLPEARAGRWGQGLTAEKMKECRWLKPELAAQFEFVEWTPDGHLRHARFIGLREAKDLHEVRRE